MEIFLKSLLAGCQAGATLINEKLFYFSGKFFFIEYIHTHTREFNAHPFLQEKITILQVVCIENVTSRFAFIDVFYYREKSFLAFPRALKDERFNSIDIAIRLTSIDQ